MTPDEYRQKHKCCATCVYCGGNYRSCTSSYYCCLAKNRITHKIRGRFCKIYEAKEFKEGAY